MIEVNQLVKRYGNHLAVDHLSFKVGEGQIYGFLGPNGAGKSTTMNIMTGYLGATEGEVIINGHNILEEPEAAKRSIGYLPEIPPLYMDMTVQEYLNFAAELKKIPKTQRAEQIEKAAELTKLVDMMPRLIKNLSKGYKQRVGLAQAILGFPPVIILDEPTVGLDPKQIIEIRDLIKTLGKKHTVILSSHILQEVSAVCDHVMIISHGRLVASDTPENLEKMMRQEGSLELEVKGSAESVRDIIATVCRAEIKVISEANGIVKCDVEVLEAGPEYSAPASEKTEDVPTAVNTGDVPESGNRKDVSAAVNTGDAPASGDPDAADIREKIFFAFADAKVPILSMKVTSVSLEEIFLELTADSAKTPDPAEEEATGVLEYEDDLASDAHIADESANESVNDADVQEVSKDESNL